MAKFGKKNVIKIDPTAYNIGLIGESGIGKSTLFKEVMEKVVGEDSYFILNCGLEDGLDAIAGAMYEDIPDFETFEDFVDDVVANKLTDYPNLKVVSIDTMDELFRITEDEVVRLHNRTYPDKQVKSINSAFGGFTRGEDKVIELILEKIKMLKSVGVAVWFVGHTKRKSMEDLETGLAYEMITTNMMNKYFNAIKTKLHVLGVASIERDIAQVKTGKKDFNGKDKFKGTVNTAKRKITFRDDNFNIDSKSRFMNIVDHIEFDTDEFINAIKDAIKAEYEKQDTKMTLEETAKEQSLAKEQRVKENIEKIQEQKQTESDSNEFEDLKAKINDFIKDNKLTNAIVLKPVLKAMAQYGYKNPLKIETLEHAKEIADLIV